jgi:lipopolysaccharide assembly outer membrane protein LptD (OstA)
MKLCTLTLLAGIAALAFGQTHQQIPAGPDTVEFSASSISENDGDLRSNRTLAHLAALRAERDALLSTYTAQHSSVQKVQAQIDALEATLAAAPKTDTHLVHLKGNVEIRTATMTLTADEAYFNKDTGEITAMGTVRVKPISK